MLSDMIDGLQNWAAKLHNQVKFSLSAPGQETWNNEK